MINLLPTKLSANVVYARHNRTLLRWCIAIAAGLIGIVVIVLAGFFYTDYQINAYQTQVADTKKQLEEQELEATQKRVEEISGSVKLAEQVLSKEILFSKLLNGIGGALPPGTALQNLNITNELDGGIDLQFAATSYQAATQVQVNLTDEGNKVFESADIQTISCTNSTGENASQYPCQVSIRALFTKEGPYNFVQEVGGQ